MVLFLTKPIHLSAEFSATIKATPKCIPKVIKSESQITFTFRSVLESRNKQWHFAMHTEWREMLFEALCQQCANLQLDRPETTNGGHLGAFQIKMDIKCIWLGLRETHSYVYLV